MKEKICKKCGNSFPIRTYVGDKYVNLANRMYCLDCSPFNKPSEKFIILNKVKEFTVVCKCCENEFQVTEQENKFPSKDIYYCSRKCANTRQCTDETKDKIRKSIISHNNDSYILNNESCKIKIIKCKHCGKLKVLHDIYKYRKMMFCSRRCKNTNCASNAGLKML